MSWEQVIDRNQTTDKMKPKTLAVLASEIKSAGYVPIILRFRRRLLTTFDVNGFEGATVERIENLDQTLDMALRINPNHKVTFWLDDMGTGYAILPKTERNMKSLMATACDKDVLWTIETPEDVKQEIAEGAKALMARLTESTVVPVTKKPFNRFKKVPVEAKTEVVKGRVKKVEQPQQTDTIEDLLNTGVPA